MEQKQSQRDRVIAHFHEQAAGCEALGSPFTAGLCRSIGEDIAAGGPTDTLLGDWPGHPRKDALSMRICGALHHGVLTGAAPALAGAYPGAQPDWSMAEVWPLARAYLEAHADTVRRFISSAPQTNETRRAIALLPGFLTLAARFDMPIHMLELGASAGLNQNWDRFGYKTQGWQRAGTSPVLIETDWNGPPPAHLNAQPNIVSRAACDLNPLNIHAPDDALRLRAYIWADQRDRLARFDAAADLARASGVQVEKADAGTWLKRRLAARPGTGLTVVYHSIFLQYPPRETIEEIVTTIRTVGDAATPDAPLAWLCYEPEALFGGPRQSPVMLSRLQVWPGGSEEILARSDGHVTKLQAG